MKEKKQAPDVFSSDLPLTHVNRYHLSNVKDLKSSANRPLLLGCESLEDAIKCIIEGCQLMSNSLTSISQQSSMLLKKHHW